MNIILATILLDERPNFYPLLFYYLGEASTEAHLECEKRPGLLMDTLHDASWARIQEIEAPREPAPEPEPVQYAKPQFTQPLQSQADMPEGTVVLFEARVTPINDPQMQLQWYTVGTKIIQYQIERRTRQRIL